MDFPSYKRWLSLIPCVLSLLLLSGCWSHRELNAIGIVSGVGVDLTESGKIQLTAQVITPAGSKAKGQEGGKESVRVLTSEGDTYFDALRGFMNKSGDRLFYPHTQVIVFGEDLARAGLSPVLDFMQRDPEIRMLTWLLVTEGKAEDVMRGKSREDSIPAMHISRLIDDYKSASQSIPVNLLDFTNMIYVDGYEPTLGKIIFSEEKGEPIYNAEGGAVFKGDRLIGWLDGEEARSYLWVMDNIKGGIIAYVPDENSLEGRIAFEIIRAKSKLKPILEEDGTLRMVVEVEAQCNIGELMNHKEITRLEEFQELKRILTQCVIDETQVIVDKAQKELESDILAFGLAVKRRYPQYWNEHQTEWETIFPELDVEILVHAQINTRGSIR
ncbi:germination protein, Ger(X)C family [Desulfitobacterium dichloroeliminans LMG P-21439]|uniref:Germination protein, Ger(X)C family n=1 Tax=Desulfitobacterium dichloroeliminans (strain LMG P-21439 / DCA1) TaxID=871963 RepID=L0FAM6_DESDL|nr:Ger(x)C family spore germination protein [Desulfitobacterium dichloroeliminans]AGA69711.1 germination protein, Ger(X)C family [Desulfitobacterium dichloroeliminans LMG P-21439]